MNALMERCRKFGEQSDVDGVSKVSVVVGGENQAAINAIKRDWKQFGARLMLAAGCDHRLVEVNCRRIAKDCDVEEPIRIQDWLLPSLQESAESAPLFTNPKLAECWKEKGHVGSFEKVIVALDRESFEAASRMREFTVFYLKCDQRQSIWMRLFQRRLIASDVGTAAMQVVNFLNRPMKIE